MKDRPSRATGRRKAPPGHKRVSFIERGRGFFQEGIWHLDKGGDLSPWRGGLVRIVRVALIAGRGFVRDNCLMRAGSLTYVTIFSLVPLLAVSFAVAKGLNADEVLQSKFIDPFLNEVFGAREDAEAPGGAVVRTSPAFVPLEPPPPAEPSFALQWIPAEVPGPAASEEPQGPAPGAAPLEDEPETAWADDAPSAGQQLRGAVDQIFAFVRDTNFTSLGTFGLIFLLYCVIKLLGATERTLNAIWGVRNTRSFTRRLTNYLAIVVITPMVMVTATGITALLEDKTYLAIQERLGFDLKHGALLALLPFFVVSAGMTFLYLALPNTRVRLHSAILGGIIAGFLWLLGQMAHVEFQLGVARINAIYSGFAALPLFLLWLYVNWAVMLLGAEVAHAHQSEPVQTSIALTGQVDQSYRERLALRLAVRVAHAFQTGAPSPTGIQLAGDLGLAPRLVRQIMDRLMEGSLVVRTDEDTDQGYLPARDPARITALEVLTAMRHEPEVGEPPVARKLDEGVDGVLAAFERQLAESPQNKSLATLAKAFADDPPLGDSQRMRPAELPSG